MLWIEEKEKTIELAEDLVAIVEDLKIMITLQCLLEFQNKQDKEIVLDFMRRFSSAMRYAYKRLLEGEKRKDLKKCISSDRLWTLTLLKYSLKF